MALFIATYDLGEAHSPHSAFLKAAKSLGWEPWIKGSSEPKWRKLPNTTLEATFSDIDAAVTAFKAIKPAAERELGYSITIEKWIVIQYTEARFRSDETLTIKK
ncbi:hypothetical protein C7U61_16725 [Rhizobium sp. JAB6]|uniref:hypothetical protein n=1 Tax=Rhizobium sp. JAB6 TaxID=2127050 RepID=UPI000D1235DE|nr:hypothetical protein [Rhizobium sp. JAB6]PST17954.1 hypothetical protein C7U61_16725 [Rhizobium sp. JAB6]